LFLLFFFGGKSSSQVHPIHADHHVLHGGQFGFKGLLYQIWATIWYATILVCIGTGAKVLTKKALYYEVYQGANWCLCGGLAAAFASIMVFESLHHRAEHKALGIFDCFTHDKGTSSSSCGGNEAISMKALRMDLLKATTVALHMGIALSALKPHHTMVRKKIINLTFYGFHFISFHFFSFVSFFVLNSLGASSSCSRSRSLWSTST
jgi:hypothetical protein